MSMVLSLFAKSILSLPLAGLAVFNLIVILEFLGRTEKKFDPKSLRRIHRVVGILFLILFLLISYFCLTYMRASGQEMSPRVAFHSALAVGALILIFLKLLCVRVYRKYYTMAVPLGLGIVLLTLTTAALSAGYHFTMRGRPEVLPVVSVEEGPAKEGASLFAKNCSGCHYADKTEIKIGPGLKGLFKRETLPVSGRPANESNVRAQIKTPFRAMPPFAHLSEEEITALLAFLETL